MSFIELHHLAYLLSKVFTYGLKLGSLISVNEIFLAAVTGFLAEL